MDGEDEPTGVLRLLMRCCCLQKCKPPRKEEFDIYVSDTSRLLEEGEATDDYGAAPAPPAPPPASPPAADFRACAPPPSPRTECAGSLSVAERTRLLKEGERAAAAAADGAAAEEECAGVDIASTAARLQKEVAGDGVAAPERDERKTALAERLANRKNELPCAFCGLGVFAAEATRDGDAAYHAACFRCGGCGCSLAGVQHGALDDDDDVIYCDEANRARSSCLARAKAARLRAGAAREAANQRLSEDDIARTSRAKSRAIEVIGDELERIVLGLAPKCARCGGPFSASDRVLLLGMVKCFSGAFEVKHFPELARVARSRRRARTDSKTERRVEDGRGRDRERFSRRSALAARGTSHAVSRIGFNPFNSTGTTGPASRRIRRQTRSPRRAR